MILAEWGAYLDIILYREALTHFLGGEHSIVREVEIWFGGDIIGVQSMHLSNEKIAFSVTAATQHPKGLATHQQRFLQHTRLQALHWINFNKNRIELCTLENQ